MPSFYRQLIQPGQVTFTFDKTYSSYYEIIANGSTDEVMIGRYALVTYGAASTMLGYYNTSDHNFYHSYFQSPRPNVPASFANQITPVENIIYENLLASSFNNRYYYYYNNQYRLCSNNTLDENDPLYSYIENLNKDIEHNYAPHNNSVFVKLYNPKGGYYYREIASLNEYLPTIDFIIDSPVTSVEDRRTPYLYKTGLTYDVHLTQTPVYLLGELNDYNEEGFSAQQEVRKSIDFNKGFYYQPAGYKRYPYNALESDASIITDVQEIGQPGVIADKYYLQTNMIDIGNTIADIWNIVYGTGRNTTTTIAEHGFVVSTGQRDTQINSTYEIAHGDSVGGKDLTSLRGIANTMIELIGYEGYEQQRNDSGQLAYTDGTTIQYVAENTQPPTGFQPVYDRSTLRGLLAEGAEFNQKVTELDATLARAKEDLDLAEDALGERTDQTDTTIYGILYLLRQDLSEISTLLGSPSDHYSNQTAQTATLYGLYNDLTEMDITSLADLIGATGRANDQEPTIMDRLSAIEGQFSDINRRLNFWTLDGSTLSTNYGVSITGALTALNFQNKVRGAMWAN